MPGLAKPARGALPWRRCLGALLLLGALGRDAAADGAPPATVASPPPVTAAGDPGPGSILAPTGKPRHVALSFSPLTLMLARYGLTLDLVPVSHHGITLTAFYAFTRTNEDSYGNLFKGWGGEIGYRYYFGHDGPRGLFLGPSLLLGTYEGVPRVGDAVSFKNWGAAADIGWQATVIDRVALGIAAGVQYTEPTVKLPVQELPAAVYANRSVMPRLNVWLGVAF
jgi:hypothetical protein